MKEVIKNLKWNIVSMALLYIIVGVLAIIFPGAVQQFMGYVIGAGLILAGAVTIVVYLIRDARENLFRNGFVGGLIAIAIGIVVLYKVQAIWSLFSLLLGIIVIISACMKLQHVIDLKRLNSSGWIPLLILAGINLGFGIFLVIKLDMAPDVLFRLLGIGLAFSGLSDLFATIFFTVKLQNYDGGKKTIEATYQEVPTAETPARETFSGEAYGAEAPVQNDTFGAESEE